MNSITYASREEWLAARKSGLGASEIAAILGENPWDSAFAVWGDKTEKAPKPPLKSEAAEWGLHLEEPIARRFGSGIAGNGVVVLGKAWFFWNRQEAILIRPGVASRGMVWQCEVRCG